MAPFTFKDVKETTDLVQRLKEGVFDSRYMHFVRDTTTLASTSSILLSLQIEILLRSREACGS